MTDGETEAQEAGASRRLMKGPRQAENPGSHPAASTVGGLVLGLRKIQRRVCLFLSVPISVA